LWECISLGIPVLVPRDTWLEREAAFFDTGAVTFNIQSADEIGKAFEILAGRIGELKSKCEAASEQYCLRNGVECLRAQLGEFRSRAGNSWSLGARFESVKLVHHTSTERAGHLDIVIVAPALGPYSWPRLKFKLLRTPTGCLLEFRRGRGWPEMFNTWPSATEDRFGPVLRLNEGDDLAQAISEWRDPQDRRLLEVLAKSLPAVVTAAISEAGLATADCERWRSNAIAMALKLSEALTQV
jgi:hypothetical protein